MLSKLSHRVPLLVVKYVPEWFPGAGFKGWARKARKDLDRLVDLPFCHVKESFEVREPRSISFSRLVRLADASLRLGLLPHRLLLLLVLKNYQRSPKTGLMKRRFEGWAQQYF